MELENIVANTVYLKAREAADGKFDLIIYFSVYYSTFDPFMI